MGCWLQTQTPRLESRSCSTRSVDRSLSGSPSPVFPVFWPWGVAQRGRALGGPQGGGPHPQGLPESLGAAQPPAGQAQPLSARWPRCPQVLNEVVIDRGPSSYLSNVDVYLDGHLITTVQGDGRWALGAFRAPWEPHTEHGERTCGLSPGVIVSTPTGSTAYAAAAGASMIHPNVPAIMITPICPHSLSFRPIVVPAGVELKVRAHPLPLLQHKLTALGPQY